MKKSNYMTRALKSRDGRFAVILGKLGYTGTEEGVDQPRPSRKPKSTAKAPAAPVEPVADLGELREKYFDVIGKRPFHGWDEEELQRRIDEAEADDED